MENQNEIECSICLCTKPQAKLLCGHQFHSQCIQKWWAKQRHDQTCPYCCRYVGTDDQLASFNLDAKMLKFIKQFSFKIYIREIFTRQSTSHIESFIQLTFLDTFIISISSNSNLFEVKLEPTEHLKHVKDYLYVYQVDKQNLISNIRNILKDFFDIRYQILNCDQMETEINHVQQHDDREYIYID